MKCGLQPVCFVLAISLGWMGVPSMVLASTTAQAEPSLERARTLHREGQDRYDTADYQGAIDLWTKAYGALPPTPEGAAMKPFVLYNIASARQKAFEIYGDVAELKQARALLIKFETTLGDIYDDPSEAEAERGRVQERLAVIEALIAEHEGVPDPEEDAVDERTEHVGPQLDPAEDEEQPPPDEPPPEDEGAGPDARLISGAILVGLGAGAAGLLVAGVGIGARANDISDVPDDDFGGREQQFDRGRTGNTLAIAGAVAAPILIGVGVTLIVLAKRKPRNGTTAMRRHLTPTVGGLSLRF